MNNIILEDGYNTDYIYSLLIALFFIPSDGLNKIINMDTDNSNTYYIQEYIKSKIIYPLQKGLSLEASMINKLRIILYHCGWLKNEKRMLINRINIDTFYQFLITDMMNYRLKFMRVDQVSNVMDDKEFNVIDVSEQNIISEQNTQINKIIHINSLVNYWIEQNIIQNKYSYKFSDIPLLIPVYINLKNNETNINKYYVNIMEGLNFETINDKIQKMMIWEVHSMICQERNKSYYVIIKNHNNDWIIFSDKTIPSNYKITFDDISVVEKIMKELVFVFYRIY